MKWINSNERLPANPNIGNYKLSDVVLVHVEYAPYNGNYHSSTAYYDYNDNKWKAGDKIYEQRAVITKEDKDNIFMLDENGNEHPLRELESKLGWGYTLDNGRVYGNYYFPPV